jgi:hypothetical protein
LPQKQFAKIFYPLPQGDLCISKQNMIQEAKVD